jgi:hypothetical protein
LRLNLSRRRIIGLAFRAWHYFRIGYGTYLTFLLGFATTAVTVYYLAITNIPLLGEAIKSFATFVFIAGLTIGLISVAAGFLHYKRTRAFAIETDISVEANPWYWRVTPGRDALIGVPSSTLNFEAYVLGTKAALLGYDAAILDTEAALLNYEAAVLNTEASVISADMSVAAIKMSLALAKAVGALTPETEAEYSRLAPLYSELRRRFEELIPRCRSFREQYAALLPRYRWFVPQYEQLIPRYQRFKDLYTRLEESGTLRAE